MIPFSFAAVTVLIEFSSNAKYIIRKNVTECIWNGIYLRFSSKNTIVIKNTISNSHFYGISLENCPSNVILDNVLNFCGIFIISQILNDCNTQIKYLGDYIAKITLAGGYIVPLKFKVERR